VVFAPDTEISLTATAALVNTADPETLTDEATLDELCHQWRWTGSRTHDRAELNAVQRLRPQLRQVWFVGEDRAVEIVNDMLRRGRALPQLVKHDEWDYHLHTTPPEAPLATRMAVDAAMAFVDVIRVGELDRLFVCAAPDCDNVGVDLSRNRSKRFCDAGCGNRMAVAAYRARRAGRERHEPVPGSPA
jgi:predicted RNA-binding Zn ribbon-like protein